MPPILDLDPLALVGTWDLSRVIVDHQDGQQSRVLGTTTLTLQDDVRIRWAESGTLSHRGIEAAVSRVLYVEKRAGGWFVTFEDGRDFHPWEPGVPVEHGCAPDLYIGTVDRVDERRWSVEWRVTGPSKDYTMASVLTRAEGKAKA